MRAKDGATGAPVSGPDWLPTQMGRGTAIGARALSIPGANWSDPMKIRPKRPDERSRCGHGIVTDLRGQDQAADTSRAQQVSTANESEEPRRQRKFSTPPSSSKARHRGDVATK
jgi:hypothetical protein